MVVVKAPTKNSSPTIRIRNRGQRRLRAHWFLRLDGMETGGWSYTVTMFLFRSIANPVN